MNSNQLFQGIQTLEEHIANFNFAIQADKLKSSDSTDAVQSLATALQPLIS
jgi:hypothetical protein